MTTPKKKTDTATKERDAAPLPVKTIAPAEPIPHGVAFTLAPLKVEELPAGSETLPAGVLRTIRVDRNALRENDYLPNGARPLPTWVVEEGRKTKRYHAVEIRGSVMCKNGTETKSYGCGPSRSNTAYLTTLAELVVYTKPPTGGGA